jgi:hypothetical protein
MIGVSNAFAQKYSFYGQDWRFGQKFRRSGVEIARCLVRALDIWANYDSNSADSDIDDAGRSQLCFAFFHSGGERVERGASGCPVAKPRNPPLTKATLGLLKLPGLSTL